MAAEERLGGDGRRAWIPIIVNLSAVDLAELALVASAGVGDDKLMEAVQSRRFRRCYSVENIDAALATVAIDGEKRKETRDFAIQELRDAQAKCLRARRRSGLIKAEAAMDAACKIEREQFMALIATAPTTMAGARELVTHVLNLEVSLDEETSMPLLKALLAFLDGPAVAS